MLQIIRQNSFVNIPWSNLNTDYKMRELLRYKKVERLGAIYSFSDFQMTRFKDAKHLFCLLNKTLLIWNEPFKFLWNNTLLRFAQQRFNYIIEIKFNPFVLLSSGCGWKQTHVQTRRQSLSFGASRCYS